jgi:hypothetical protein
MKTINKLSLLAVIATAGYLNVTTGVGQVFTAKDVINNRAVANSPRAKEAFPWLTRTPSLSVDACCKGEAKNALTEVKKNRAYAASPRVRELFPELTREATSEREFTTSRAFDVPASVRNNAIANSPRMREQYPALSREAVEKVPAQVGASRQMEIRK